MSIRRRPPRHRITVRDLLAFTMGMGILLAPPGSTPIQRALDELQIARERQLQPLVHMLADST
jgi:hypothetical protein